VSTPEFLRSVPGGFYCSFAFGTELHIAQDFILQTENREQMEQRQNSQFAVQREQKTNNRASTSEYALSQEIRLKIPPCIVVWSVG
jgi:predicted DNA repair protein MutK